jgi:hypothetical protein
MIVARAHARRDSSGCVHRSRTIFCRPVSNLTFAPLYATTADGVAFPLHGGFAFRVHTANEAAGFDTRMAELLGAGAGGGEFSGPS